MAKGLRASINKTNKKKLRAKVFGPVEDARTERLSAKLLELASQPKPPRTEMELEEDSSKQQDKPEAHDVQGGEAMDVDTGVRNKKSSSSAQSRKPSRIHKKRRGKATSSITFPTFRKGQRPAIAKRKK